MATGWAEFIERMVEREKAAGRLTADEVWTAFLKQASVSAQNVELLKRATQARRGVFGTQPAEMAIIVARLLAPIDWPPEWEAIRPKLVNGIEHLLRETDPASTDSFPALLNLQNDADSQAIGYGILANVRHLLLVPCRRDELRIVAQLCNQGVAACTRAYRRALKRIGNEVARGSLLDARMRYVVAFQQFAQAARDLNDAVGAVIFVGLDARLEGPED